MFSLPKDLGLNPEKIKRLAILGIGSDLHADDNAGMLIVEKLMFDFQNSKHPGIKFFLGATAPENLSGPIKEFLPTHLIMIDCADLHQKPGTVKILEKEEIGSIIFLTHSLPLKVMIDYLLQAIPCEIITIGIQPKLVFFGAEISKEVKESIDFTVNHIKDVINSAFNI